MPRNIFAYTAPGSDFPDFISLNEVDGKIVLTVRGNRGSDLVEVQLPRDQLSIFHENLTSELAVSDK